MTKFKEMQVYEYVDEATARKDKEGNIVDATWVDDWLKQKSRLVAREFARGRNEMTSSAPLLPSLPSNSSPSAQADNIQHLAMSPKG